MNRSLDERRLALLPPKWRELAEGRIDPRDLDDEEVFTGRLRDPRGVLGPRPSVVPQVFLEEQRRRALDAGSEVMRRFFVQAHATMAELASDPNVDAGDRFRAAKFIIERYEPTPTRIVVAAEDPAETLFRAILNDPQGLIVPGEATDVVE